MAPLPRLPHAFSTERFEIHCGENDGAVQEAAGWAEELLGRLESILGRLSAEIRPRITFLRSESEFRHHAGIEEPHIIGLLSWEEGDPEILLPLDDCAISVRETLAHELAHLCLAKRYPSNVRWVVEAVCEFLETELAFETSVHGTEHVQDRLQALEEVRTTASLETFREDPFTAAWFIAYLLIEEKASPAASRKDQIAGLLALKESDLEPSMAAFKKALAKGLWDDGKLWTQRGNGARKF